MWNTLLNLYAGRISPWERRNHHDEEEHEIIRQIDEEEKLLFGQLSPEAKERYQKLLNLRSTLFEREEEKLFAYSFTFGATLMLDMLDQAEAMNSV